MNLANEGSSKPSLTPHILRIPKEIRQQIFSYFLIAEGDDDAINVDRDGMCTFPMGGPLAIMLQHWELTRPLILCRQLFHELMPLFYGCNKFYFPGVAYLKNFLKGVGARRRELIRHVIIGELEGSVKSAEHTFRLLGESCRLQNLEISLDTCQYSDLLTTGFPPELFPRVWCYDPKEEKSRLCIIEEERDLSKIEGVKVLRRLRGLKTFILKDRHLIDDRTKDGSICPIKSRILKNLEAAQNSLGDLMRLPKQGPPFVDGSGIPAMLPATREVHKFVLTELWELLKDILEQRDVLSRGELQQYFEEVAGAVLRGRYLDTMDDYIGFEDDPDETDSSESGESAESDDGYQSSHLRHPSDDDYDEDDDDNDDDDNDDDDNDVDDDDDGNGNDPSFGDEDEWYSFQGAGAMPHHASHPNKNREVQTRGRRNGKVESSLEASDSKHAISKSQYGTESLLINHAQQARSSSSSSSESGRSCGRLAILTSRSNMHNQPLEPSPAHSRLSIVPRHHEFMPPTAGGEGYPRGRGRRWVD